MVYFIQGFWGEGGVGVFGMKGCGMGWCLRPARVSGLAESGYYGFVQQWPGKRVLML